MIQYARDTTVYPMIVDAEQRRAQIPTSPQIAESHLVRQCIHLDTYIEGYNPECSWERVDTPKVSFTAGSGQSDQANQGSSKEGLCDLGSTKG